MGGLTEDQRRTSGLSQPIGPGFHPANLRGGVEEQVTRNIVSPMVLLRDAIEMFHLSRRATCTPATMRLRQSNLGRFARAVGPATPLADMRTVTIERYLVGLLQSMKPISMDQHNRDLRVFFRWAVNTGRLASDPMHTIPRPRIPLPLPDVPTEDELVAVLASCNATLEGVRNRAMILPMADVGLRAGEVVRARVRDCDLAELSIVVRSGQESERPCDVRHPRDGRRHPPAPSNAPECRSRRSAFRRRPGAANNASPPRTDPASP